MMVDLAGAVLDSADLRTAQFTNPRNWKEIISIEGANVFGITNREFVTWALSRKAVRIERDEAWRAFLEGRVPPNWMTGSHQHCRPLPALSLSSAQSAWPP